MLQFKQDSSLSTVDENGITFKISNQNLQFNSNSQQLSNKMNNLTFQICLLLSLIGCVICREEVVYAVNFGGEAVKGSDGVQYQSYSGSYQKHTLTGITETIKDYQIYRTIMCCDYKQYFNLPVAKDGVYTLTLKFYDNSNDRTMYAWINEKHEIIAKLRVFDIVGVYTPLDRNITFEVNNGQLKWNGETSHIDGDSIKIKLEGIGNYVMISAFVLFYEPTNQPPMELTTTQSPIKPTTEPCQQQDIVQTLLLEIIEILKSNQKSVTSTFIVDNEL
jgi:hypothetical protein